MNGDMTFDRVLLLPIINSFVDKLAEHFDDSKWNAENLEKVFDGILADRAVWVNSGEDVIKSRLVTDGAGQSIAKALLEREYLGGVLQEFRNIRDRMDSMTVNELTTLPYTYEWVADKIKFVILSLTALEDYIVAATKESEDPSEEVL